jgi:hypothetical protein
MSAVLSAAPTAPSPRPATVPRRTGANQPHSAAANAQRSKDAKQRAAAILEVLAGVRTPAQAALALGVTVGRYYLLEDTALGALVAACEPRPRGRNPNGPCRVASLQRECERWQRECARQQALVRAAQRSIGLAAPTVAPAKDKGKKRRRRPVVRALAAANRLREEPAAEVVSTVTPQGS